MLNLLSEDATITRAQIASQLNLTESQVIHYLRIMKKNGLIEREGSTKGGKWIILK
jgi:predicted HTH transcriptional regulator